MDKLYKNNVRMNDMAGVNRVMQRSINALIQGDLSEDKCRVIGYMCNILYRGLEKGNLEERLEALEGLMEQKRVS